MATADREKVAHLLRRFGFGASEMELDYYAAGGLASAIDKLLEPKGKWTWDVDPMAFANRQGTVNVRVMQGLWYLRMLATERPLEEKMALFWHHFFATSAQKVDQAFVMARHIDVMRTHGTGNFLKLLTEVSHDPAMIYWLDTQESVKGKPNENFAREVMELFTLGYGRYTEKDIQEAARAFTGWRYGRTQGNRFLANLQSPRRADRFFFDAQNHDDGEKTILGKTGAFTGDQVLSILCERPETALWVTRKVWEFFVYAKPTDHVIEPIAAKFRDAGLELKVLLRAIMESDEFYSARATRKLVKNPIDFVIATARQLGTGASSMQRVREAIANPEINAQNGLNQGLVRALAPAFSAWQATKAMGMELFYPPDVAGWHLGDEWITSATMLERMKWSDRLFVGSRNTAQGRVNLGADLGGNRGPSVGYNPSGLFGGSSSPAQAVTSLLSVFDLAIDAKAQETLLQAATSVSGGQVTAQNAGDVARAVSRLMFGSPEFQMA